MRIESREDRVIVPKGWGEEEWIVNNNKYCGKILRFKKGKKCSLHYHEIKDEVFLCTKGAIQLTYHWTDPGEAETIVLVPGDSFHVPEGLRHQMKGLCEENELIEFSTHHEDSDSYRIEKGD
jgi:oxalate decarboxylase/phosphoglucose isomerase-like protein (cupin superfamily)